MLLLDAALNLIIELFRLICHMLLVFYQLNIDQKIEEPVQVQLKVANELADRAQIRLFDEAV